MANRWVTIETLRDFIFGGSEITADGDCSHEIKTLAPWKESYDQHRQHIKKQRHHFANKGPSSQGYSFSSGTTDWFQIGNGVHQGCILSPCLFNLYVEYIMRNDGLEEAQAGIKIARRKRRVKKLA